MHSQSMLSVMLCSILFPSDAAGMTTCDARRFHARKDNGLVKDVFQAKDMLLLTVSGQLVLVGYPCASAGTHSSVLCYCDCALSQGNMGLGHCRYPTAGTSSCSEAQPLYTNYPFGIR